MAKITMQKLESTKELDRQFEARRDTILNAKSEWTLGVGGRIYYISNDGDDANDGLSPETPWRTIAKHNSECKNIPEGSVILFRRGDVWNCEEPLLLCIKGATYSAYGEGEKPMISKYAAADNAEDWIEVHQNIWVYNGKYRTPDVEGWPDDASVPGTYLTSIDARDGKTGNQRNNNDVGAIVYTLPDGREAWGAKVTKEVERDVSVEFGRLFVGVGFIERGQDFFRDERDLKSNYEFFHNHRTQRLYIYWDNGNPGDYFKHIKLVLRGYLTSGIPDTSTPADMTVDNLALKYVGAHAINVGNVVNFTVRNCDIGWIGGSIQIYYLWGRDYHTRFGEGVQNWRHCNGYYLLNNYFHQVFDGATSSQCSQGLNYPDVHMDDVLVKGNLYEYNSGSFEFWVTMKPEWKDNPNYTMSNFLCTENMVRRAGWGQGDSRPEKDSACFQGSFTWPNPIITNCQITGNTAWDAKDGVLYGHVFHVENAYNFHGNTVVHQKGRDFAYLARDFDDMKVWDAAKYKYDEQTLEHLIDKKIIGENDFYYTDSCDVQ